MSKSSVFGDIKDFIIKLVFFIKILIIYPTISKIRKFANVGPQKSNQQISTQISKFKNVCI